MQDIPQILRTEESSEPLLGRQEEMATPTLGPESPMEYLESNIYIYIYIYIYICPRSLLLTEVLLHGRMLLLLSQQVIHLLLQRRIPLLLLQRILLSQWFLQVSRLPWCQLAALWVCHSLFPASMPCSEVGSLNVCYHSCHVLLGRCSYGRRSKRSHGSSRAFSRRRVCELGRVQSLPKWIATGQEQPGLGKLGLEGCSITWRI